MKKQNHPKIITIDGKQYYLVPVENKREKSETLLSAEMKMPLTKKDRGILKEHVTFNPTGAK